MIDILVKRVERIREKEERVVVVGGENKEAGLERDKESR